MADKPLTPLEVVHFQAAGCDVVGSKLYGKILRGVLADMRAGGVCERLLSPHQDDPFGSALALRFMGAVHRIVLEGRAPSLAAVYPTAGGDADAADPVSPFLAAVEEHEAEIGERIHDGVQTNEVGRCAALVGGYAEVQRRSGLPLRVLEVGTSGGLNLRFDHYCYDTGEVVCGDPASPLRFEGAWDGAPPWLPASFSVADRRGCDRNPIDATTEDGRLTLLSYVWPDQPERVARLEGALAAAKDLPVAVDRASADEWVAEQLSEPTPGVATVVVHSIVMQYLGPQRRERFRAALADAGRRASEDAPLAWLRMEPAVADAADVRLTYWPDGADELLGATGYHGAPVRWGYDPR